jgi:para-aminobenzoate synthetase component 1
MGSMTGAPKISAMQLMEQYEDSRRGVYSGAIGYFDPDNDFDFNVVIRTLLYNRDNNYLSFHAGSAITYHAEAEKEYEECLLKVKAILEVLGQPNR